MKKILVLFAIILLAFNATALTVKAGKASYEKGEQIIFEGACVSGEETTISALMANQIIFDAPINCFEGAFSYAYTIDFLDPSGNWSIKLAGEKSEAEILVIIQPTSESAYYRITFLSPSSFSFSRGETVYLSIEAADSGTPLIEAEVIMHDAFGRKIQLIEQKAGVYDINYSVPFNAPLGKWLIVVTAKKTVSGKTFGGERALEISVSNALFDFKVTEPVGNTYEQSDIIPFKAEAFYRNGLAVSKEKIEYAELITSAGKEPMQVTNEGELMLDHQPKNSGQQIYRIAIRDKAGNEGEKRIELTITCSITCFLKSYGLIILVILLVTGLCARLFYKKTEYSFQLLALRNERKKTMDLMKTLQKEYFETGVMPAQSYKSNMTNYKAKLIEIEEKIKQLEHKIEEEK